MIAETEPTLVSTVGNRERSNRIARRRLLWFMAVALLTVVADQLSKLWVRSAISVGGQFPVWPGIVHLSDVRNRGAAWGMLAGHRWFLVLVALGVMWVVGYLAREIAPRSGWACTGLGLILGGAIGNLIDRVLFGSVTDFIDMDTSIQWIRDFPVFNLADSALTVGVALLLIDFLILKKPTEGNGETEIS